MSNPPPLPSYPEALEIQPLERPPDAIIHVPGSKSITNRALILAALSQQPCKLIRPLHSEDTHLMMEALRQLGHNVWTDEEGILVERPEEAGPVPVDQADLFVGNSGTSMRFLAALVSLGHGTYRLDGVERMRERPIEDLLAALRSLGVDAWSEDGNGCPPVIIRSQGLTGGTVRIRGSLSSQFLSGLLLVAPLAQGEIVVHVHDSLVSQPYVEMTLKLMQQFGAQVEHEGLYRFRIPAPQEYEGVSEYHVEPDASGASYFFAAAAITGGQVRVPGLGPGSLQGDIHFVEVLRAMGCHVEHESSELIPGEIDTIVEGRPLRGVEVDMNAISDTVMTLAAIAPFAAEPTTILNVGHIRHKETDRLAAIATELRKLGGTVEEFPDGLRIHPAFLHGATVETYNDHRMAMSLALIGLRTRGVVIRNPGCVAKTYPHFWDDFRCLASRPEGE
jgi:3-phosphoshikimate 1-carboxyvinyltransferase